MLSQIVALALVAYAITYVIVDSVILQEIRDWVYEKLIPVKPVVLRTKLEDLIGCRYCTGFWITAPIGLAFTDLSVLGIIAAYGLLCLALDHNPNH